MERWRGWVLWGRGRGREGRWGGSGGSVGIWRCLRQEWLQLLGLGLKLELLLPAVEAVAVVVVVPVPGSQITTYSLIASQQAARLLLGAVAGAVVLASCAQLSVG